MPARNIDEARIRELAFQLWEAEGCPDGCAEDHWFRARMQLEAEVGAEPETETPRRRPSATRAGAAGLAAATAPAGKPAARSGRKPASAPRGHRPPAIG